LKNKPSRPSLAAPATWAEVTANGAAADKAVLIDSPFSLATDFSVMAPRSAPNVDAPRRRRASGFGRKPKLTQHQKEEARRRIAKGESTRDLAKSYDVSISTISRLTL
jgi:helix-turn-helix resolvase-like protein